MALRLSDRLVAVGDLCYEGKDVSELLIVTAVERSKPYALYPGDDRIHDTVITVMNTAGDIRQGLPIFFSRFDRYCDEVERKLDVLKKRGEVLRQVAEARKERRSL